MIKKQHLPYYAVIFTSKKSNSTEDYNQTAILMEKLAKNQPGFLGVNSARSEIGITVSYWKNLEAIKIWKNQQDHIEAQNRGKNEWYSSYSVRIAKVEFEYGVLF